MGRRSSMKEDSASEGRHHECRDPLGKNLGPFTRTIFGRLTRPMLGARRPAWRMGQPSTKWCLSWRVAGSLVAGFRWSVGDCWADVVIARPARWSFRLDRTRTRCGLPPTTTGCPTEGGRTRFGPRPDAVDAQPRPNRLLGSRCVRSRGRRPNVGPVSSSETRTEEVPRSAFDQDPGRRIGNGWPSARSAPPWADRRPLRVRAAGLREDGDRK
jgi:hypothetical protein